MSTWSRVRPARGHSLEIGRKTSSSRRRWRWFSGAPRWCSPTSTPSSTTSSRRPGRTPSTSAATDRATQPRSVVLTTPGVVEVFCNIHARMNADGPRGAERALREGRSPTELSGWRTFRAVHGSWLHGARAPSPCRKRSRWAQAAPPRSLSPSNTRVRRPTRTNSGSRTGHTRNKLAVMMSGRKGAAAFCALAALAAGAAGSSSCGARPRPAASSSGRRGDGSRSGARRRGEAGGGPCGSPRDGSAGRRPRFRSCAPPWETVSTARRSSICSTARTGGRRSGSRSAGAGLRGPASWRCGAERSCRTRTRPPDPRPRQRESRRRSLMGAAGRWSWPLVPMSVPRNAEPTFLMFASPIDARRDAVGGRTADALSDGHRGRGTAGGGPEQQAALSGLAGRESPAACGSGRAPGTADGGRRCRRSCGSGRFTAPVARHRRSRPVAADRPGGLWPLLLACAAGRSRAEAAARAAPTGSSAATGGSRRSRWPPRTTPPRAPARRPLSDTTSVPQARRSSAGAATRGSPAAALAARRLAQAERAHSADLRARSAATACSSGWARAGWPRSTRPSCTGRRGSGGVFVVKRLRPHVARNREAVDQFIDEAKLGSSLVHPNIVPVFDFGKVGDEYFIAQEYIVGRDIARLTAAPHGAVGRAARRAARALRRARGAGGAGLRAQPDRRRRDARWGSSTATSRRATSCSRRAAR